MFFHADNHVFIQHLLIVSHCHELTTAYLTACSSRLARVQPNLATLVTVESILPERVVVGPQERLQLLAVL